MVDSGAAPTARDPRLGGDHHLIARHRLQGFAKDRFGAVDGSGVEEIDPEVERLMYEPHRLGLVFAGAQPEPAEPAAAEPGDADFETGPAEYRVFHLLLYGHLAPRLFSKPISKSTPLSRSCGTARVLRAGKPSLCRSQVG